MRPPVRELSPRVAQIVRTARAVLAADGAGALTMRRLADDLGIRAPSLYKHLPGKGRIELLLVEAALTELGETLHAAVIRARAGRRVSALLTAYRRYALAHPDLYRLTTSAAFPREQVAPGLEDWAGQPFLLATGEPYAGQALWGFAHGTVILELDRRFLPGSDLRRTWAAGAAAFEPVRSGRP